MPKWVIEVNGKQGSSYFHTWFSETYIYIILIEGLVPDNGH